MTLPNVQPTHGADDVFAAVQSLANKVVQATMRGGPVVLTHVEAGRLVQAVTELALLAAPTPQFYNPIRVWGAEWLRDRVLQEMKR